MKELELLVGASAKRKKLKLDLLASCTNEEFLKDISSYHRMWDKESISYIIQTIKANNIYHSPTLVYNIIHGLIKYGNRSINIDIANCCIGENIVHFIPHINVHDRFKVMMITMHAYNGGNTRDVIDAYIQAGIVIPHKILLSISWIEAGKPDILENLKRTTFYSIKCSVREDNLFNYGVKLLEENEIYTCDSLDTLFKSVVSILPKEISISRICDLEKYWSNGGTIFPEIVNPYTRWGVALSYIELLKDSSNLSSIVIHELHVNESLIRKGLYTHLYRHQLNDLGLIYRLPKSLRLKDINHIRDEFMLVKSENCTYRPICRPDISVLKTVNGGNIDINVLELYFMMGGEYNSLSKVDRCDVTMDMIDQFVTDFGIKYQYLCDNTNGDLDRVIKKCKGIDLAYDKPNSFGVCGGSELLQSLCLSQYIRLMSTKGTYIWVLTNNPKILKYYVPEYLSIVDINSIIPTNPDILKYVDLSVYDHIDLCKFIDQGVIDVSHIQNIRDWNKFSAVTQTINYTLQPNNICMLYSINIVMWEIVVRKYLNV